MKVPLLDLKLQYKSIKTEIDAAIARVVDSQHFILGPEVENLEKALCAYLGCGQAVAVSSGTDALLAALMAIDLQPGDEVIVPDYSFFATAGVVSRLNAVPVFCDIDPATFNIDTTKIVPLISPRTKAIIPVHLFGQAAEMDRIMEIAGRHDLVVIEDAAQAIGSCFRDGRALGTIGHMGCYSFFPSKNLGCFGDGGLVVTDVPELGEKLRILRVHGHKPKYVHRIIGGNFRIDALQAAVLSVKLPHLEKWTAGRRSNAALYTRLFIESGLAQAAGRTSFDAGNRVLLPGALYEGSPVAPEKGHGCPTFFHIYNQYVIRVEKRDELREFLTKKEIGTEIYYPIPFHRQECFRNVGAIPPAGTMHELPLPGSKLPTDRFPISDAAAQTSLALPIFPELRDEQIKYVVNSIAEFFVK